MFIAEASAQSILGGASSETLVQFLPLVAIVVVFYFMLFRPQQQKAKKHKQMLEGIRRGDRVLTSGGIIGTVSKVVNDAEISVEIAEGVRVRVLRGTITEILAKTEPAKDDGDDEGTRGKPAARGKTKAVAKPAATPAPSTSASSAPASSPAEPAGDAN